MKVTLVNPPYTLWRPETEYVSRLLGPMPPLGLVCLATYVRSWMPALDIEIVDATARGLSAEQAAQRVIESRPQVLGLTITTAAEPAARTVATQVKAALPGVTVIVGGPHVSALGENVLGRSSAFDVGVIGEGERTFHELLEALGAGRPVQRIPGLVFRDPAENGRIVRTAAREPIEDLDSLPPPAWELLDGFPARYAANVFFSPGGPAASLTTSRGCPYGCLFCDQSTFGRRWRGASAEHVFAAVRGLQELHGIRYLIFSDDTFTLSRGRVLDFCRLVRDLERPLAWSCDANVNNLDREMLGVMRRAGCWSISFGLESGSPRVLESLGKNITLDRAARVVRETRAAGIHAKGLFMLGAPEESAETVRQTRQFIRSLPLSTINISKFTPYPGSQLSRLVADQCPEDYGRLNGMNFVVPSKHLSIPELEREYDLTIRSFFSTLRAVRTHAPILLGRRENLRRLLGALPAALAAKFHQGRRGPEES